MVAISFRFIEADFSSCFTDILLLTVAAFDAINSRAFSNGRNCWLNCDDDRSYSVNDHAYNGLRTSTGLSNIISSSVSASSVATVAATTGRALGPGLTFSGPLRHSSGSLLLVNSSPAPNTGTSAALPTAIGLPTPGLVAAPASGSGSTSCLGLTSGSKPATVPSGPGNGSVGETGPIGHHHHQLVQPQQPAAASPLHSGAVSSTLGISAVPKALATTHSLASLASSLAAPLAASATASCNNFPVDESNLTSADTSCPLSQPSLLGVLPSLEPVMPIRSGVLSHAGRSSHSSGQREPQANLPQLGTAVSQVHAHTHRHHRPHHSHQHHNQHQPQHHPVVSGFSAPPASMPVSQE
ncbi:unnamed protein product [Protopolystoma xenopodis]|uniref:Uncharacterized protein n=1 Tax=Protopolystoma xenopodis TaxID=117903 RepID=A0A448XF03_9PLAT|nr:unnamed protein product [Protopolystoma xenopodis]